MCPFTWLILYYFFFLILICIIEVYKGGKRLTWQKRLVNINSWLGLNQEKSWPASRNDLDYIRRRGDQDQELAWITLGEEVINIKGGPGLH